MVAPWRNLDSTPIELRSFESFHATRLEMKRIRERSTGLDLANPPRHPFLR
jgi:hypothetical protein